MTWRWAIAVVVLGGCYKPDYTNCEISCASGFCPSGLTCEQGYCITPGSAPCMAVPNDGKQPDQAGPPGDRDNDTILDGADNCPDVSNREQYNEDSDSFGDACDPCPPLGTMLDNSDSDGDGVGAGCDPNPNLNTDRLVFFEGFAVPNVTPAGVVEASQSWLFGNGIARVGTGQPGPSYALLWAGALPAGLTTETISIRGTLLQMIGGGNVLNTLGVVHMAGSISGPGITCELGFENGGGTIRLFDLASGARLDAMPIPAAQALSPFTMRSTRRGGNYTCDATAAPGLVLNGNGGPMMPNPKLGLYVHTATSQFEWIMVVASP
jgi:hypothetical protein